MTVIVMGVVMSMLVRMGDLLMNMIVRVFLIRILRLKAGWVRVPMVGIVMRMRMRVRHLVVPMRMRMIGHNSRTVLLFRISATQTASVHIYDSGTSYSSLILTSCCQKGQGASRRLCPDGTSHCSAA